MLLGDISFKIKWLIILNVAAIVIKKRLLREIVYFLKRIGGQDWPIYKIIRLRFGEIKIFYNLIIRLYLFSKYTVIPMDISVIDCINGL